MATAKKSTAKKAAPKKASAKKSSAKGKKQEPQKSEAEIQQERSQQASEHKQSVKQELGLPKNYGFNPNELDPDRSANVEMKKAHSMNIERLNKEAEGQTSR